MFDSQDTNDINFTLCKGLGKTKLGSEQLIFPICINLLDILNNYVIL